MLRILRNQSIVDKMASNIVQGELSNIAAVLAVPQVITTYYSIDAWGVFTFGICAESEHPRMICIIIHIKDQILSIIPFIAAEVD